MLGWNPNLQKLSIVSVFPLHRGGQGRGLFEIFKKHIIIHNNFFNLSYTFLSFRKLRLRLFRAFNRWWTFYWTRSFTFQRLFILYANSSLVWPWMGVRRCILFVFKILWRIWNNSSSNNFNVWNFNFCNQNSKAPKTEISYLITIHNRIFSFVLSR